MTPLTPAGQATLELGGRDAVPARDDRSNGERDAAGRSSTPVRLIDKASKPEEGL